MSSRGASGRRGRVAFAILVAALLALGVAPVADSLSTSLVKCTARGKLQVPPPDPDDERSPGYGFLGVDGYFHEAASGSCVGGPDGSYDLSLTGSGGSCIGIGSDEYGIYLECADTWQRVNLRLTSTSTNITYRRAQEWLPDTGYPAMIFTINQFKDNGRPKSVGVGLSRTRASCGDRCTFVTVVLEFTW